jgi:hypothetical protein
MLNTALDLLRKDRLLKYVIGGGTWILLIGLLGSVAYNGLWDDDNKWTNLSFGRQRQTHAYAVATIVMALLAFLVIAGALAISVLVPSLKLVELILWAAGYALTVIVIAVQGAGLGYTTYAVGLVQDEFNYLEQYDEFKEYVGAYGDAKYLLQGFALAPINALRAAAGRAPLNDAWLALDPAAFRVAYREKAEGSVAYAYRAVASCAFDWAALDDAKFAGGPCSFGIGDGDAAACIGGWTGAAFKDYWCYLWEQSEADREFNATGPTLADWQKREQVRIRDEYAVDSIAAYYRHNTYLIGINVAALIASAVSVALDIWIAKQSGAAAEGEPQPKKEKKLTDVNEGNEENEGNNEPPPEG